MTRNVLFLLVFVQKLLWYLHPKLKTPQNSSQQPFAEETVLQGKERKPHFPKFLRMTVSNEDQYEHKRLIFHIYILLCSLKAPDNHEAPNGQGPHLHSNP